MKKLSNLKIKIFADGADKKGIIRLSKKSYIKGFTTNPTLMRKAKIKDYKKFAKELLKAVKNRPISFEVLADDFENIERQALEINSWGENVYVKVPVMNTKRKYCFELIKHLAEKGVRLNMTAVMTVEQIKRIVKAFKKTDSGIISIFAGRIADTGRDPVPIMKKALKITKPYKNIKILWASTRELFNIFQADKIGCDIITVNEDILKKIEFLGKDLDTVSLDTVKMFYSDATKAGYRI